MKKKITIEAHLLQPGMTLADRRYRIDSLLGNNGIMVTYKGYDTFRKKVVVIRELFPVDIVERDRLHDYHLDCKKLSDEALFESMKEHVIGRAKKLIRMYPVEGIANVLTFLEERGTVYSIEEYVEGMTLDKYLLKRHSAKFTVEDLMKLLAPVIQTLASGRHLPSGTFAAADHGAARQEDRNCRLYQSDGGYRCPAAKRSGRAAGRLCAGRALSAGSQEKQQNRPVCHGGYFVPLCNGRKTAGLL